VKPALEARSLPRLPGEQVDLYWANGVLGPLQGLDWRATQRCREGLTRYFLQSNRDLRQRTFHGHVLQPWLYDLACHPSIVGAVASVLGTDSVLLYSSIIISRSPGKSGEQETGVGWHADGGGYRPLQPQRHFVTAFVALTTCHSQNGCLEFQRQSNGTRFLMELDEGQFSLHSASVQHQATLNSTASHRICVVLRYISAEVHDVARGSSDERDWALLACGRDSGGHFRLLGRPNGECTPEGHEVWDTMRELRQARYGKLI